ncbi:unnamed protein product [Moneuplotes crassus]|uniref:Uncharacterized protein n=2 Tax=Euplotes crassus TaxID=5936 RepID=A0AAD2D602_EUPCR|nr:unnamed protein product [Moneuplotes crassus]|eukprot:CAMPEP_0197006244 /NCGR_PEP_ID=MMETSP1380-20130617/33720_1 /TAXON_ID=5936 /ORGANISM="Euplotes crassus, Strain CT5" /LENGTH=171 /DNA_ID=CAMNT_0042425749 /DNA_START=14 /DNA_END=529 /DNA_ORIENTATION=-
MSTKQKPYSKNTYVDPTTIPPLPTDVMADLTDAFNYYKKESESTITFTEFKNILHNFGFHKTTKNDLETQLQDRHRINFKEQKHFTFDDCVTVVGYKLTKGDGREEEAKECYKLFDKKDRSHVNVNDIKLVFGTYLKPTATDEEIKELVEFADQGNMGHITQRDFIKFYNS